MFALSVPLSVGDLLFEGTVDVSADERTRVNFYEAVGCPVWKVTQVFELGEFRVFLVCNGVVDFEDVGFNLGRQVGQVFLLEDLVT